MWSLLVGALAMVSPETSASPMPPAPTPIAKAQLEDAPTEAEIGAFMAQHPNMFKRHFILSVDCILFDKPADVALLNQRLTDDHSLEAVAASLTKLGIPFTRGKGTLDLALVPTQAAEEILNLPAGEPFVAPSGNNMVVSVITGRELAVPTNEEARRTAIEGLHREQRPGNRTK